MDFLGAKYFSSSSNKDHLIIVCKRFLHPKQNGRTSGYTMFNDEIRTQIKQENPGSSISQINSLIGKAWRNLSVNQKAYYDRKSKERKSFGPMTKKCTGRLRFKMVDGQGMVSTDGLVDYVLHSKELSIGLESRRFLFEWQTCQLISLFYLWVKAANFMRPTGISNRQAQFENSN